MSNVNQFTIETADAIEAAYPTLLHLDREVKRAVGCILAGEAFTPAALPNEVMESNPFDADLITKGFRAAGMGDDHIRGVAAIVDVMADQLVELAKELPLDSVQLTIPTADEVKERLKRGTWSEE